MADVTFNVKMLPHLNLLVRSAIRSLDIDICTLIQEPGVNAYANTDASVHAVTHGCSDITLHNACQQLCAQFPELFKPELGYLKAFELEIKFKQDAKPVFFKPRTVPLAFLEDLSQAYDEGIKKGV